MSKELFARVRENQRKLRECPKHRFEVLPPYEPLARIHCTACGGDEDLVQAFNYVRGFIAAGGDPLVVAPWWHEAHKVKT